MATFPSGLICSQSEQLCTPTVQTFADIQSTPVHRLDTILIEMKSNFDGDCEVRGVAKKLLFGSATTSGFSSEGRDRKVTYYELRHAQSV
jgi:hypothetical protein